MFEYCSLSRVLKRTGSNVQHNFTLSFMLAHNEGLHVCRKTHSRSPDSIDSTEKDELVEKTDARERSYMLSSF